MTTTFGVIKRFSRSTLRFWQNFQKINLILLVPIVLSYLIMSRFFVDTGNVSKNVNPATS